MTRRFSWWLAWTLTLVTALAAPYFVALAMANGQALLVDSIVDAGLLLVFAIMGSVIASRHPRNVVGWIFCVVAFLCMTGQIGIEYGVYGLLTHPGSLPAALGAALYGGVGRSTGWDLMITLVPLYFPNGRLVSPRWRWAPVVIGLATIVTVIGIVFAPIEFGVDLRLMGISNPIAVIPDGVGQGMVAGAQMALFLTIVPCALSVVLRFRRSAGVERQQLKWFVYAAGMGAPGAAGLFAINFFNINFPLTGSVWFLVTVGMPISAGIAILRYRLYDIDVIINRTLVYGTLTAILATLYFALVLGAQTLTRLLTGQPTQSPVVIVLSTLAIAALVQPLRTRLQRGIDRRFYRAKYDAAKTIERFAATLRQQVEFDQLRDHLLTAIEETMQPVHVSLWLSSSPGRREQPTRPDPIAAPGGKMP